MIELAFLALLAAFCLSALGCVVMVVLGAFAHIFRGPLARFERVLIREWWN